MTRRLFFRATVNDDLAEITECLSDLSPSAAQRLRQAVFDIANALLTFPERGPVEPLDPSASLRRVIVPGFRNYLVYYRVSPDALTILHVFHSSRDLPTLLKSSGDL